MSSRDKLEPVTADVWVFDLDNTLYPRDCNLFAQIDVKMKNFIDAFLCLVVFRDKITDPVREATTAALAAITRSVRAD